MAETDQALRSLGRNVAVPSDRPSPELLDRFESPAADPERNPARAGLALRIDAPEFTSLCPITGQPDWARIVIRYQPDRWCVESKSLKLYLGSFRNFGEFHEACVNRICNDLVRLLEPRWLIVEGRFTPRGGIPFWPVALYRRDPPGSPPEAIGDSLEAITERMGGAARREDAI